MRNTFSRRRFLAENQYSWRRERIPCLSAADTSASTYRYCLYLWTKYDWKIPCLLDSMDNKIGWEKKKIFSLSFFQPFLLSFYSKHGSSSLVFVLLKVLMYTDLCFLSAALRQGIHSRRQEYWFSARKRLLLKGISHDSWSYFFDWSTYKKWLPSLWTILFSCIRYVSRY